MLEESAQLEESTCFPLPLSVVVVVVVRQQQAQDTDALESAINNISSSRKSPYRSSGWSLSRAGGDGWGDLVVTVELHVQPSQSSLPRPQLHPLSFVFYPNYDSHVDMTFL